MCVCVGIKQVRRLLAGTFNRLVKAVALAAEGEEETEDVISEERGTGDGSSGDTDEEGRGKVAMGIEEGVEADGEVGGKYRK